MAHGSLGMHTSVIGLAFRKQHRVGVAAAVGTLVVAVDLWLSYSQTFGDFGRFVLGLVSVGALFVLGGGDRRSLGLCLQPDPGWRFWWIASSAAAGLVLVVSLAALALVPQLWDDLVQRGDLLWQSNLLERLAFSCLQAPVVEELVYRIGLSASLAQAIGRTPTIVVSGIVFGLLHVLYQNPGPDNAIAGFILGWAFLRSGTILIPLLMHAGGNLLVISIQLAVSALSG